jgi:RNA polymerase sigma-70 factor (ECF subfamily)
MSRPRGNADRERFEQVYLETRAAVLAYLIRRTETSEDAADVLGEVYLIAWRRIAHLPEGAEARLWLFGVARRVLANQRRRLRTQVELAVALEETLRTRLAGPDSPAEEPMIGSVLEALSELTASDRELVMLSAWEELTPAEIAVVFGRPAAVVRVRLHRARARMRSKLMATNDSAEPPPIGLGRLIDGAAAE